MHRACTCFLLSNTPFEYVVYECSVPEPMPQTSACLYDTTTGLKSRARGFKVFFQSAHTQVNQSKRKIKESNLLPALLYLWVPDSGV